MKKILFVARRMDMGGVEIGLLNLLSIIDYTKYDVTLLLEKAQGVLLDRIPRQVHLVEIRFDSIAAYKLVELDEKIDFVHYLQFKLLFLHCVKNKENYDCSTYYVAMEHSSTNLTEEFDLAIDYHGYGFFTTIFMLHKIHAKKYATFIHDETMVWLKNIASIKDKIDYYFCVSQSCAELVKYNMPCFGHKIKIFRNVIDVSGILNKAREPQKEIKTDEENVLVSVGRLEWQKGFDIAVEAAKMLVDQKIKFKWYVIGTGTCWDLLKNNIYKYNMEDIFVLLGLKENPYPYMKRADFYVQTSRHEGYGLAICEARILGKTIITTDIPCVREQCTESDVVYYCETTPEGISKTIKEAIKNPISVKASGLSIKESINDEQLKLLDELCMSQEDAYDVKKTFGG